MSTPIRCSCGSLRAELADNAPINHGLCYCKDCQAFAYALGKQATQLDAQGGTVIVQTAAAALRITAGAEQLACLRLTEKGLLRWYARCCNTAIGNTAANPSMGFVGLIGSSLGDAPPGAFGPPRMRVFVDAARGPKKPLRALPFGAIWTVARIMLGGLLGSRRASPFWDAAGALAATPRVLSTAERMDAMRAMEADHRDAALRHS